ncbi:helix-turn-helix domain-containing protein [Vibrio nigripulchritudo]|uniref:HTH cro/C1-type domain-containing protein n=1 Tax=Vibrio nigripulchritudo SOn1 TaxID=1238450 RepID=A0AAV2VWW0_9VIBR|nr:helix-turn-helix domain-containing protein [Vibrio nigripulchritudo]CCN70186.1 conserved hypothetical protein [Vibrio nigripulchritudo SFn118]CCO48830.1 conserved hypothetical protein [Vibrio nigripulchritudo SOn1]
MDSKNFVLLAIQTLGCTQKELALKLGVSPAQITKWKSGEHMSLEMEKQFRLLSGIGDRDPNVVALTGGIEQADKWEKLTKHLAEVALDSAETGYVTYPLADESELLCWSTLDTLNELGVEIPKTFPEQLDFDYCAEDFDGIKDRIECMYRENIYSSLIYSAYLALNDVYGFYAAYISEIMDHGDMELMGSPADNIEACLLNLAFCKVGADNEMLPHFSDFKYNTLKDYKAWIEIVKNYAFNNNIPLRAELMNLILCDHDDLGHEAEAESLGFNTSRLHPDIYMNEILQSHRVLHQVLPVICKKLGITEDELKLDSSKLYLK